MNYQKSNTKEAKESFVKTKLTKSDGIANRKIGYKVQHELVKFLSSIGFECEEKVVGPGPDIIIEKNGNVTIGSCKSLTLYDEPNRKQIRIHADECKAEIREAKKRNVSMTLFVMNIRNGRWWAKTIPPKEITSWNGLSTPVLLARDDYLSDQMCKNEFYGVLRSLSKNIS